MPQKVLMGKVLAVDPYTLGGGSNKGALHSISYIEKYGLTFLHSRKPYDVTQSSAHDDSSASWMPWDIMPRTSSVSMLA